jgi:hypothetical protein
MRPFSRLLWHENRECAQNCGDSLPLERGAKRAFHTEAAMPTPRATKPAAGSPAHHPCKAGPSGDGRKRHQLASADSRGSGSGTALAGVRNRKRPRYRTGRLCVRERLEAVEMPLNRTKKSQNALKKPFLSRAAMKRNLTAKIGATHLSIPCPRAGRRKICRQRERKALFPGFRLRRRLRRGFLRRG